MKLYLSSVLRRGDIVRYARTMQKHADYYYRLKDCFFPNLVVLFVASMDRSVVSFVA